MSFYPCGVSGIRLYALAVIKGRYLLRILVKSPRNLDLSTYVRQRLAAGSKTTSSLKLEVDVDPQSFL